jgi:hypothetical protein
MTRSTTTKHDTAHEQKARPVIPAPRRSPEQRPTESRPAESGEPAVPAGFPPYPLVGYALAHATALRPRRH